MPGVYQGVRMRGCLERTRALVPGKTQGVRGSQRECLGRPRALGDHRESAWVSPERLCLGRTREFVCAGGTQGIHIR